MSEINKLMQSQINNLYDQKLKISKESATHEITAIHLKKDMLAIENKILEFIEVTELNKKDNFELWYFFKFLNVHLDSTDLRTKLEDIK